ncbi:hypothetical protein BJX99DRAFT_66935 [Aspergillus californicus]
MAAADSPQVRAANVCANCKARKKRCDKSLPRCRYCAEHDVPCVYRLPNPSLRHRSLGVTSDLDALMGSRSQDTIRSSVRSLPTVNSVGGSTLLLYDSLMPLPLSDQIRCDALAELPPTAEATLCIQAHRLLVMTMGMYLDGISVRYFQTIHFFIPIVSRRRFHAHLISFGVTPKADFALVLLCMGLLTYTADSPENTEPKGRLSVDAMTFYVTTKSLLAQAQALCAPTVHLIQAGVLLAVYEYAHGHLEQAFVSIGSCARMAYSARLHNPSSPSATATPLPQTDWVSREEETITWWGILICERTILCELAVVDQPLGSVMPARDSQLPIEVSTLDQGNWTAPPSSSVTIECLSYPTVGAFGRTAQAAWLLDGVLQGLSMRDPDRKRAHLHETDRTLQSFLAIMMQQCGGNPGVYCVAIALSIRGLFLLHWHLLDQRLTDCSEDQSAPNSHAALDTITKIVIDIAGIHEHVPFSEIDGLPPSCVYIMRAALKHIHHSPSILLDEELQRATLRLRNSLQHFELRWGASTDVSGSASAF